MAELVSHEESCLGESAPVHLEPAEDTAPVDTDFEDIAPAGIAEELPGPGCMAGALSPWDIPQVGEGSRLAKAATRRIAGQVRAAAGSAPVPADLPEPAHWHRTRHPSVRRMSSAITHSQYPPPWCKASGMKLANRQGCARLEQSGIAVATREPSGRRASATASHR